MQQIKKQLKIKTKQNELLENKINKKLEEEKKKIGKLN